MNLHIVPDHVFSNKFYENLQELGLLDNNKIIVRTNHSALKHIQHKVPFAKLYSSAFNALTGDTMLYDKVFIHQFTPLLYRWVAGHDFRELHWMVWGADLYNLPSVNTRLYENLTLTKYVNRNFSWRDFLYRAKVSILHSPYRDQAYAKVKNVLTWMIREYDFALHHLPGLQAGHRFFFYENPMPYQALDTIIATGRYRTYSDRPTYILGNSSTAELNHLDVVAWMNQEGIVANLSVPVSYGDPKYTRFLKNNLSLYKGGEVRFIDRYMNFREYLEFLYQSDGLIMNNIRPQGYGNIFLMMYMGKKVFLNENNLSLPELNKHGLAWHSMPEMKSGGEVNLPENQAAVSALLSHDKLLAVYRDLFS